MTLNELCDYVILIGALFVAVTNIYNFFAKPTSALKKRHGKEIDARIKAYLDENLPEILYQHDLQTRQKYLNDRQQYLLDIKNEVLSETKQTLDEIKSLNIEQSKNIELLTTSSKDMLRQRIMSIYHQYKKEKRFPIHEKEKLEELYKDYKAENGNSYIDKYYKRMLTWETYYEDEDSGYDDI